MNYHLNVVQTTCKRIIPLKFIESFGPNISSADQVVDKLKDDFSFTIVTISGKEYTVSSKEVAAAIGSYESPTAIAQAVYDKWKHIHREA